MGKKTMPKQNRHRSKQDVATPVELIYAVEEVFGKIDFDLAASKKNSKAGKTFFSRADNSLARDWEVAVGTSGVGWLNPPYADIEPWVAKAASYSSSPMTILVLVPASVGSVWWRKYVHDEAEVLFLSPRVRFVGHNQGYVKDLALLVYGRNASKGVYRPWRWNEPGAPEDQSIDLWG